MNRRDATSLHGMQRTIPVPKPDNAMVNVWNIFAQKIYFLTGPANIFEP